MKSLYTSSNGTNLKWFNKKVGKKKKSWHDTPTAARVVFVGRQNPCSLPRILEKKEELRANGGVPVMMAVGRLCACQDRYGVMTRVYYKDAHAAVIVLDSTRERTWEGALRWKADLDSKVTLADGTPVPAILLANKCDVENSLTDEKLSEMQTSNDFLAAFQTSAKDNTGIDESFRMLANTAVSMETGGQYEIPYAAREGNVNTQFYCADQIQKCFDLVFDQSNEINSCHEEKKSFDECYAASLDAVHFDAEGTDTDGHKKSKEMFFAEKTLKYRASLDQCFVSSPFVPRRSRFDDATYARAIYGYELADELWGLPELIATRPSLDSIGICRRKEGILRIFGSGISRISTGVDPTRNNISSSCMIDDDELMCYRQTLNFNQQFVHIRQQTVCRMNDASRLRACICNLREQLDMDLRSSMLECVQNSAKKQTIDVQISTSLDEAVLQEQVEPSKLKFDTPGAVINGQCMCSCEREPTPVIEKKTIITFPVDNDENKPTNSGSAPVLQNAPRFIQPHEAIGKVFWGKNSSQEYRDKN
ncbi:unnamed protein product [Caenorhabditis auriculariae]|uniref:Uncharacterized protein n=1 Tax=Caenorhabditis auriculariae TaxID=2777116 RepID=A0A8S1GW58_9PELO|nr:unnamed protein product [Caenorhabditis auriculariae]